MTHNDLTHDDHPWPDETRWEVYCTECDWTSKRVDHHEKLYEMAFAHGVTTGHEWDTRRLDP